MKLRIERCYGTRFYDGETKLDVPDNFIAFYNDRPIIVVMYKYNSSPSHGCGSMTTNKYSFIDLYSMASLKDVNEIEVDAYKLGIKRG